MFRSFYFQILLCVNPIGNKVIMSNFVNLSQLLSQDQDSALNPDDIYQFVMCWRRTVLIVSSSLLLLNIFMIIKSKQYIYNTLKLFLFLEIFTLLGQLFVLPHNLGFQGDRKYFSESQESINDIIEKIIDSNPAQILPCSLEAYINLFCYNVHHMITQISYLFALLITLYVRRVIDNTHKYFIRRHLKLIIYVVLGTLLVYSPPFILSFFKDVPYSFGPVGFQIKNDIFSGQIQNYLFYCGITTRTEGFWGDFLSIFNMALIPVLMFIIHCVLLYRNKKSMRFLKGLEELNPRQWFILQSGTLSFFIFVFQSINFIKYILSLINSDSSVLICIVGILNMGFDFLPIVLVYVYYKKYYKRGKRLQQKSLLARSLTNESFETRQILQF